MNIPDISGLQKLLGASRVNSVDVGARGGAQAHWKLFSPMLEIDAFEPDAEACEEQRSTAPANEHWHAKALGDREGSGNLYVVRKASSSSLYPPNPAIMRAYVHRGFGDLVKEIEIPLARLSNVLRAAGRPGPDLVKLDVQGAELDVLRGIDAEHWGSVLALQVEVAFVDYYLGQPLFWELDQEIRGRGYVLFDLLVNRYYRVKDNVEFHYLRKYLGIARNRQDISRRVLSGDALYLRPPESILESGDPRAFAKMLVILCIYRCFDEALWFLEEGLARSIIGSDAFSQCIEAVRSLAPRPSLRQRADWIGKMARRWSKRLNIGRGRKAEFWLDRSWDY